MPWTTSDVDRFKSGLSQQQKEQWVEVANSALRSCLNDGGSQQSCEASAIRQANGTVNANASHYSKSETIQINRYTIREETHQGEKHIVVPVVMMVEGVHSGSHGPVFHSEQELSKFTGAWNGIPVVVYHPEEQDDETGETFFVSANAPHIVDYQVVGRVYNTHFEDGKLKAEAWLSEQRLRNVSADAFMYIQQGSPLDVSVGVFTEDSPEHGEWNGETYSAVARNHRPDHLALLPGAVGACSWEDGCGIRANQKSEEKGGSVDMPNEKGIKSEDIKSLISSGYLVKANQGYRTIMSAIQKKLDRMDTDARMHMLEEVFEDSFVYRVVKGEGESELLRRGYTFNEQDESVEFGEDVTPVARKVEFVEVQSNSNPDPEKEEEDMEFVRTKHNKPKGGNKTMANKKCTCQESVDSLIASEYSVYTEEDRDWLESLEDSRISKLVEQDRKLKEKDEQVNANSKGEDGKATFDKDEAFNVLKEHIGNDPNKFMELLPDEAKSQMKHGLKLHQEHREKLIKGILNNTEVYSEEELKAQDTESLEKLSKAIKPQVNYSGLGGGMNFETNANDSEVEPLLPAGFGPAQESKSH